VAIHGQRSSTSAQRSASNRNTPTSMPLATSRSRTPRPVLPRWTAMDTASMNTNSRMMSTTLPDEKSSIMAGAPAG
jgi:hypothetical protein